MQSAGVWQGFGFVAAWRDDTTDPPIYEVDVRDWADVLECIARRFPASPNIALDIRAKDRESWVLCEVNGALGIDYSWVLGLPNLLWFASRISDGAWCRGLGRLGDAVRKTLLRYRLAQSWEFEKLGD